MKKANSLVSLLLAALMLFSLAACGKTAETQPEEEETITEPAEETQNEPAEETQSEAPEEEEEEPYAMPKGVLKKEDPARYEADIRKYEAEEIPDGQIMFYGDSTFTRWSEQYEHTPLAEALAKEDGTQVCVNRGFGGSTTYDLCYYYERIVKAHKPSVLCLTTFLNDASASYAPKEMINCVKWLCEHARKDMPGIKIYISDYRPINRVRTQSDVQYFENINRMLLDYAAECDDVTAIEFSKNPMFYTDAQYAGSYNNVDAAVFVSDNVHFSDEGYERYAAVWREVLKEYIGEAPADTQETAPAVVSAAPAAAAETAAAAAPAEEEEEEIEIPDIQAKKRITRLQDEITKMKREPIEEGKIVFYGSSCFNYWKADKYASTSLEDVFVSSTGEKVSVNHGFGGCTALEMCYYYEDMVKAWKPRALVLTSFLNDLSQGYTVEETMECFFWICDRARKDMPGIRIFATDYRPNGTTYSAAKIELCMQINGMLADYAAEHDDFTVIELSKAPFYYTDPQYVGTYTHLDKSLYIEDNVHFTPHGYDLLAEVMLEALKDVL